MKPELFIGLATLCITQLAGVIASPLPVRNQQLETSSSENSPSLSPRKQENPLKSPTMKQQKSLNPNAEPYNPQRKTSPPFSWHADLLNTSKFLVERKEKYLESIGVDPSTAKKEPVYVLPKEMYQRYRSTSSSEASSRIEPSKPKEEVEVKAIDSSHQAKKDTGFFEPKQSKFLHKSIDPKARLVGPKQIWRKTQRALSSPQSFLDSKTVSGSSASLSRSTSGDKLQQQINYGEQSSNLIEKITQPLNRGNQHLQPLDQDKPHIIPLDLDKQPLHHVKTGPKPTLCRTSPGRPKVETIIEGSSSNTPTLTASPSIHFRDGSSRSGTSSSTTQALSVSGSNKPTQSTKDTAGESTATGPLSSYSNSRKKNRNKKKKTGSAVIPTQKKQDHENFEKDLNDFNAQHKEEYDKANVQTLTVADIVEGSFDYTREEMKRLLLEHRAASALHIRDPAKNKPSKWQGEEEKGTLIRKIYDQAQVNSIAKAYKVNKVQARKFYEKATNQKIAVPIMHHSLDDMEKALRETPTPDSSKQSFSSNSGKVEQISDLSKSTEGSPDTNLISSTVSSSEKKSNKKGKKKAVASTKSQKKDEEDFEKILNDFKEEFAEDYKLEGDESTRKMKKIQDILNENNKDKRKEALRKQSKKFRHLADPTKYRNDVLGGAHQKLQEVEEKMELAEYLLKHAQINAIAKAHGVDRSVAEDMYKKMHANVDLLHHQGKEFQRPTTPSSKQLHSVNKNPRTSPERYGKEMADALIQNAKIA